MPPPCAGSSGAPPKHRLRIPPSRLTRRTFVKGALGVAGFAPFASGIRLRGAAEPDAERRNRPVVIVGAGAAGLAAATELQASGFDDVVLLEARDRIGGRIWTDTIGGDIPIDLGASWIHGVDGNPISAIARENDIATHPTDYDNDAVHFHGVGEPGSTVAQALGRFRRLAEEQPGATLGSVYERYLATYAPDASGKRYLEYLLNTMLEHEFGADLGDLSLESIEGGSTFGGPDVVFPGGYRQIVDTLAGGLAIRLGQAVTEVDYSGANIVVRTADGATFEAAAVIVTVPLGVLKKGLVSFHPALPSRKGSAIAGLEMGVLNKTCLLFDDVFWDRDVELIGYVSARRGHWAETLNLYPYTGRPVLMMFNAGAYGARVERFSDGEIVAHALEALANMYGAVPRPRDARITRWRSDPWARGAYSYVPAGSSFERYAELAEPVHGKVFFAGEATHGDYPSTVHGAFLSGVRAARQIVASSTPRR